MQCCRLHKRFPSCWETAGALPGASRCRWCWHASGNNLTVEGRLDFLVVWTFPSAAGPLAKPRGLCEASRQPNVLRGRGVLAGQPARQWWDRGEGKQPGIAWVHTGDQHVNYGKGEMLAKGSSETLSSGAPTMGSLLSVRWYLKQYMLLSSSYMLILNPTAVSASDIACFFSKGSWRAWGRLEPEERQAVLILDSRYCVK